MCDPVIGGIAAGVGGAASSFGGLKSAADQKTAEVNNYKRQLQIRSIKWDGQRAMYGTRLAEFDTTVDDNVLSASRAYADEQSRLNDLFKQADTKGLDAFTRLMENMRDYGSGRTAQRREARDLAKYGRSQALATSNLLRAHENYQSRVEGIREKLRTTNRAAYSKVQFKPQPGVAPVKPNVDMTAANLSFIGGIASAVGSGMSAYNSLKAPDVGNLTSTPKPGMPNAFNQGSAFSNSYNFNFGAAQFGAGPSFSSSFTPSSFGFGNVPSSFSFTN